MLEGGKMGELGVFGGSCGWGSECLRCAWLLFFLDLSFR